MRPIRSCLPTFRHLSLREYRLAFVAMSLRYLRLLAENPCYAEEIAIRQGRTRNDKLGTRERIAKLRLSPSRW